VVVFIALALLGYYRLQRFYRVTSRQLKRLDSSVRSPLYSTLADVLRNAVTVQVLTSANCEPP